jgi:hypothetical protein
MKTSIVFDWEYMGLEVPENHKSELIEHALERITEQEREGFVYGELHRTIEDIHYEGHWKIKEVI